MTTARRLLRPRRPAVREPALLPSVARALAWVRGHEARGGGIRVHSGRRDAYPEVTGYFVPTLLAYGETDLARRCVRWLQRIQRPDGGIPGLRDDPYVFDTGQVLRGFLAARALQPVALEAARRAAQYLLAQMVDGGRGGFGKRYTDRTVEAIHLYVLPPLQEAAAVFGDDRYRVAADRCLEFYRSQPDALRLDDLTHFLAYELEALLDLGRKEDALPVLDALRAQQAPDGSVPGRGPVPWVCTPGLAQLAVCWYKAGLPEPADRAMAWLEAHQSPSGGFLGGIGPGADYFPDVELSWAAKFFLDADACRRRSHSAAAPPSSAAPFPSPREEQSNRNG